MANQYNQFKVKPRFTSLFMAALLLLVANCGAPASGIAIRRTPNAIVSVYKTRRVQQEVAEYRESGVTTVRCNPTWIRNAARPTPARLLDHSLFQRPPPFAPPAHS